MATLNVSIADGKLGDLMDSIGDVEASTDEERVTTANSWLTEIVRNQMWNHQRSVAATAVADPLA